MKTSSFVISLDFELHWGVFDHTRPEDFRVRMMETRAIIPKILDIFEMREVKATWAVVGALLCESKEELIARMPPAPRFQSPKFGIASCLHEIGANEASSPMHFAPSLVREILNTAGQELGTHTFTHLYALEAGVSTADVRLDLQAAKTIVEEWNGRLESVVFPRNQFNSVILEQCVELGLKTFRGNSTHWAYRSNAPIESGNPARRATRLVDAFYPVGNLPSVQELNSFVDVPATLFLRPDIRRPIVGNALLNRVKEGMTQAAKSDGLFHLWWHPHNFGVNSAQCMHALAEILRHYRRLHEEYGMESRTMGSFGSVK